MKEDDARRVLLVRAVEIEDGGEALLTREDRQAANAAGVAGGFDTSRKGDEHYLAQRAAFAFGRLTTRFPSIEQACRASQWPRWLGWAGPVVAFALGVATNEVGNGKRLNLIAFPLIGMLAWNALVYLWLLVFGLRHKRASRVGAWIARWAGPRIDEHQPLGRAVARFGRDWLGAAGRLTTARVSRTLHLGAAAFAVGVVAGLYLRALGIEYRAGWESTFLQAPAVHTLLTAALGPASLVTGVALPSPEHLANLRWSAGPGEVAAPWIHLYAATAALFILAPRLLLAIASGANAARLKRRVPVPGREDFHVRRLLRAAQGGGAEVRVLPYGFTPPDTTRRTLAELLTAALGDATRTQVDAPIPYGGEEEWLARAQLGDGVDHFVILFNLASTPEAENHGALVAGVQKLLAGRGTALSIVLDEAAFRERSGGGDRLDVRKQAWERMLAATAEHPFAADFSQGSDADLVRRLESALVRSPTLGLKR